MQCSTPPPGCSRSAHKAASYELLYTPVARRSKRPAKPIIDVAGDQLGDGASSLIIIAILAVAVSAETAMLPVIGLGVVAFAVALWFMLRLNEGYVDELASSLRAGTLEIQVESIVDATTFRTVTQATQGLDREVVLARIGAQGQPAPGAGARTCRGLPPLRRTRAQRRAVRAS